MYTPYASSLSRSHTYTLNIIKRNMNTNSEYVCNGFMSNGTHFWWRVDVIYIYNDPINVSMHQSQYTTLPAQFARNSKESTTKTTTRWRRIFFLLWKCNGQALKSTQHRMILLFSQFNDLFILFVVRWMHSFRVHNFFSCASSSRSFVSLTSYSFASFVRLLFLSFHSPHRAMCVCLCGSDTILLTEYKTLIHSKPNQISSMRPPFVHRTLLFYIFCHPVPRLIHLRWNWTSSTSSQKTSAK